VDAGIIHICISCEYKKLRNEEILREKLRIYEEVVV
jgi:hypothetical protein